MEGKTSNFLFPACETFQIFVVLLEPIVQDQEAVTFTPKPRIRQYWVWTAAWPFEWQVCKADKNTGDALIEGMLCPQKGTNYEAYYV
jgi:hypothetical protein